MFVIRIRKCSHDLNCRYSKIVFMSVCFSLSLCLSLSYVLSLSLCVALNNFWFSKKDIRVDRTTLYCLSNFYKRI